MHKHRFFVLYVALMMVVLASSVPASESVHPQLKTAAISRADCQRLLTQHSVPPAGYVPGVDAHGSPVARADLEAPSSHSVLSLLAIVVESDLAALPGVTQGKEASVRIGVITLDDNGTAYLNGQRLTADDKGLIESKCTQDAGP